MEPRTKHRHDRPSMIPEEPQEAERSGSLLDIPPDDLDFLTSYFLNSQQQFAFEEITQDTPAQHKGKPRVIRVRQAQSQEQGTEQGATSPAVEPESVTGEEPLIHEASLAREVTLEQQANPQEPSSSPLNVEKQGPEKPIGSSEVLHDNLFVETKDGSSCHHSYDEDHSDLFDSFQMKGIASDDIANVLQGMAKVTTESSPILVLGEDHGKDKIVDPASKPSADNPKESEATDYMDDPKLGETLRFMVAELKKKRKRELEEGPANPNRIKILVVSYPSSKSLDDSDTPINIDRVPPVYRSLGRAFSCNDASRLAIVLDLNNVLMITHRKSINPMPPDVSSLYFYVIEDKEDRDITYYVRADAAMFILHASQLAKVFIWSSCTLPNLSRRIDRCFSQVKVCLSGWAGQEMCHRASWQMGKKPIFFKSLETFAKHMQGLGKYSTLLLDDSSYKNHLNEKDTYVVLPSIEQQSDEQWNGFLKNDVLQFLYTWVDAKKEDRFQIVKECKFDVSEFAEHRRDMLFIKKNLEGGGTIYPPRNSGLHEKREPENPGSASGSPCKHGHPRPQYKMLGTQGRK
ncbi:hypothetical protein L7F22_035353 [Adiantum nelumboides]|nr:hypothetical protein [Adiantum nelumboides]